MNNSLIIWFLTIVFLCFCVNNTFAQGAGINGTGEAPDADVMLDVKGTTSDNTKFGLEVKKSDGTAIMSVRNDGTVGVGTTAPTSTMHVSGSSAAKVTTITAATYTAAAETHILADGTSNPITITLPVAANVTDRVYFIVKTDASANTIIIDASGAETINGATTQTLSGQFENISMVCDGTSWHIENASSGIVGGGGSCPSGFSSVNAQYCIETDEHGSASWWNAVDACVDAGYKLCTWGEWYGACVNGVGNDMTDDWEWVDDSAANSYPRYVGNGSCTVKGQQVITNSQPYHCCYYK